MCLSIQFKNAENVIHKQYNSVWLRVIFVRVVSTQTHAFYSVEHKALQAMSCCINE